MWYKNAHEWWNYVKKSEEEIRSPRTNRFYENLAMCISHFLHIAPPHITSGANKSAIGYQYITLVGNVCVGTNYTSLIPPIDTLVASWHVPCQTRLKYVGRCSGSWSMDTISIFGYTVHNYPCLVYSCKYNGPWIPPLYHSSQASHPQPWRSNCSRY